MVCVCGVHVFDECVWYVCGHVAYMITCMCKVRLCGLIVCVHRGVCLWEKSQRFRFGEVNS